MDIDISMSSAEIDENDIDAVVEVLRSGRLALGPRAEQFERLVADYVGVRHAIAVSSGTAALHLIVRALGLTQGDEVLVPSFTFAASANALLYEGVTPVFVDIDSQTFNLDPNDLEHRITPATKAIVAVDVFGHPVEWDAIEALARDYGLHVIDDSCEALGAEYKGRKVGQFGNAAAFAFYPNKQITTGEGGIIVTDDDDIAALAYSMRNQGRGEMGAWLAHERLGFNYRMDEMSAALGISQMQRLDDFLAKRKRVADQYTERLRDVPGVTLPVVKDYVRQSWFVYVITLDEGRQREPVMHALAEKGIPTRGYFSPLHDQPYIRQLMGEYTHDLPVTESVARRTMALPFHNDLSTRQIDYVCDALRSILSSG